MAANYISLFWWYWQTINSDFLLWAIAFYQFLPFFMAILITVCPLLYIANRSQNRVNYCYTAALYWKQTSKSSLLQIQSPPPSYESGNHAAKQNRHRLMERLLCKLYLSFLTQRILQVFDFGLISEQICLELFPSLQRMKINQQLTPYTQMLETLKEVCLERKWRTAITKLREKDKEMFFYVLCSHHTCAVCK